MLKRLLLSFDSNNQINIHGLDYFETVRHFISAADNLLNGNSLNLDLALIWMNRAALFIYIISGRSQYLRLAKEIFQTKVPPYQVKITGKGEIPLQFIEFLDELKSEIFRLTMRVEKEIDEYPILSRAAILPQNRGRYLQEIFSGKSQDRAFFWNVALPELRPRMFHPGKFIRDHDVPVQSLVKFVRKAFLVGWGGMPIGAVTGLAISAVFGLPFTILVSLVIGGVVISTLTSIFISLAMHVTFGRGAVFPGVFLVLEEGKEASKDEIQSILKEGYIPVIFRSKPKEEVEGLQPMFIKGANERKENNVATVYIIPEADETYDAAASSVLRDILGNSHYEGMKQALDRLSEDSMHPIDCQRTIVLDRTQKGLSFSGDNAIVVPRGGLLARHEIMSNIDDAERFAREPEIGFKVVLTNELRNELRKTKRFNHSLAFSVQDFKEAGKDAHVPGTNLYTVYDGTDKEKVIKIIRDNAINGIFLINEGITESDINYIIAHSGKSNVLVAGVNAEASMRQSRKYVVLNLDSPTLKGDVDKVRPGSVVMVKIGEKGTYTEEQINILKGLPSSTIVIFNAREFRTSLPGDVLDAGGAWLIALLGFASPRPEEEQYVQRKAAYKLDIGTFEKYKSVEELETETGNLRDGNYENVIRNQDFFKAVEIYAHKLSESEKVFFIYAVIERLYARQVLAELDKPVLRNLADIRLEMILGEVVSKKGKNRDLAKLARTANINAIHEFEARISGLTDAQVQEELYQEVIVQERIANGNNTQEQVGAAGMIIWLIGQKADQSVLKEVPQNIYQPMEIRATQAILEAG
jgi:hypothetical protein